VFLSARALAFDIYAAARELAWPLQTSSSASKSGIPLSDGS